jgi:hypothetical protein
MARKRTSSARSGSSLGRILGAVIPIAALGFLLFQQVNFLAGRSLLVAFGDIESTYRAAWFELDGDVVAKDVALYPYGPEAAVRFERMQLETPGWFWLLRNLFDRKLAHAHLERVHLTLTGLSSEAGMDPTLGDLGPIGAVSASPFEAEGCMQDGMWLREELGEMGLVPEPTTLEFDYRVADTRLDTRIVLRTPGVSLLQFQRRETLPKPVNALLLDTVPTATTFERWEVSDQGFVEARNAFCAKKDGVDVDTFVARHVQSVARLLETVGLSTDAAALEAYRDFARNGGQLAFGGEYVRPLHSTELYAAREDGSAMPRMHGVLEHGTQRVAVQWQRFDPRPLPGRDLGEATFAALERERGGTVPAALPSTEATNSGSGGSTSRYASSLPTQATDGAIAPGGRLSWDDLPR